MPTQPFLSSGGPPNHWTIRVRAARDAQVRTRFAFLASTVISVALIIVIFNFEFSWYRNFANKTDFHKVAEVQQEVQKEILKNWVDSSRLKIAVLGIDLGGSDATLLGSISLYILTTWFYYCMRRENHLIARLLIDADRSNDDDIKLAAYHAINSYTVFTTIGDDDPIRDLRPPPPHRHSVAHNRLMFLLLVFLPAVTILFMIGTDLWSLTHEALARDPAKLLSEMLSSSERTQIEVIDGIGILVFGAILSLCNNIRKCEGATEGVLRQFYDEFIFKRAIAPQ
jgi:hypothetical protein